MVKQGGTSCLFFVWFAILLVTIRPEDVTPGNQTVHILGLFPLSGPYATRGELQAEAMYLAVNETFQGDQRVPGGRKVEITTTDTKCNSQAETQVVLQKFLEIGTKLVIIGGGCDDVISVKQKSSSIFAAMGILQVTFEKAAECISNGQMFINLAPSISNLVQAISSFLRINSWENVILLSNSTDPYYQYSRALSHEFSSSGVNVAYDVNIASTTSLGVMTHSETRIVVTCLTGQILGSLLCSNALGLQEGRQVLVALTEDTAWAEEVKNCELNNTVYFFSLEETQWFSTGLQRLSKQLDSSAKLSQDRIVQASYAFDATKLALDLVSAVDDWSPQNLQQTFSSSKQSPFDGISGKVQFTPKGFRESNVSVLRIKDNVITTVGSLGAHKNLTVKTEITDMLTKESHLHTVTLPAFIIMTSLASLGVVYAVAILVFNILKQNDRLIKLTSPYINSVIALGAVLAYVSVGVLGTEYFVSSNEQVARLRHATTFTLTISSTLIYGSVLTKTWRVFMVFKNMQFNGKTTKDEHLLLGVVIVLFVDIVILLGWTYADPIVCVEKEKETRYEIMKDALVSYRTRTCSSKYNVIWVLVIVGIKAAILTAIVYCAWQARHVTLPSLKDSQQIYASASMTFCVATIFVMLILVDECSTNLLYILTSACIITITYGTLSWLFLPKILLARKYSKKKRKDDTVKFLFSESMKKTRARTQNKQTGCFGRKPTERKYAHDLVVSEIENLKMAIKQKDATIRELTDRLFYGTEKFQTYLRTPRKTVEIQDDHRKKCLRQKDSVRSMDIDDLYINSCNSLRTVSERVDASRDSVISRNLSEECSRISVSSEESDEDLVVGQQTTYVKGQIPFLGKENKAYDLIREYSCVPGSSLNCQGNTKRSCAKDLMSAYVSNVLPQQSKRSVSPNHDSAIENMSPSSDNNSDAFTENGRNGSLWSDNVQVSVSDCGDYIGKMEHLQCPPVNGSRLRASSFEVLPEILKPIPRHPVVGFDSALDDVAVTEV